MKKKRKLTKQMLGFVLCMVLVVSGLTVPVKTVKAAGGSCTVADCGGTYDNGFCSNSECGGYEAPAMVSDTHYSELNSTHAGYYAIENAGQLYWFAALVNGELTDGTAKNTSANAVLTADITVNTGVLKEDGSVADDTSGFRQWTPIGCYFSNRFSGVFDGNYHVVRGLYHVNTENAGDYAYGLIGWTSGESTDYTLIQNVGVEDSYLKTYVRAVGGICGNTRDYTKIINCYTTATIETDAYDGGGIVGCLNEGNKMISCYDAGVYSGQYITPVHGKTSPGEDSLSYVYYLSETDSEITGAEYKTKTQFASGEVAYLLSSSDEGKNAWGQTLTGDGAADAYPVLGGEEVEAIFDTDGTTITGYQNPSCEHIWSSGTCTACGSSHSNHTFDGRECTVCGYTHEHTYNEDTLKCTVCEKYGKPEYSESEQCYLITNASELYWFADAVNGGNGSINGKLMDNIVVNQNVLKEDGTVNDGTFIAWTPIGKESAYRYSGTFDGNCKTVSGLYFYNNTSQSYAGLFGYINGASINKIGLKDSYFYGLYGYLGGICGRNESGTITNCYSEATVGGATDKDSCVGGICGFNLNTGSISSCYAIGTVSGNIAGSICGVNNADVKTCYSLSSVNNPIGSNNGTNVDTAEMPAEQFASGEVAYLLNGETSEGELVWGQNVDGETKDAYPVWGGATIYSGYKDCSGIAYTNDSTISQTRPEHSPNEDDGNCLTEITCSVCGQITTEAHISMEDDGDCTTAVYCNKDDIIIEAKAAHTPNADDGDCTTAITCNECGTVTTEAKAAHTPNADDGDCATAITCSECGTVTTEAGHIDENSDEKCDTCEAFVDGIGANLAGYTISLNGNIGVNFYMELDTEVANDSGAYMLFTLPNGDTKQIAVADATQNTTLVEGKTYYVFSCEVASYEMTQGIKAQMFDGNGNGGKEYSYTVRDYAEYIINNTASYSSDDVAFAKAMLNYGACSQTYFEVETDNLANKNLDVADQAVATLTASDLETYKVSSTSNELGTFAGYSLTLKSETTLKAYFKPAEGVDVSNLTFTANGQTVTPVKSGDYYVLSLENIKAWDLDTSYTFKVSNDSAGLEFSCSALSYGYSVLNMGSSTYPDTLIQLISALRVYQQKSEVYVSGNN